MAGYGVGMKTGFALASALVLSACGASTIQGVGHSSGETRRAATAATAATAANAATSQTPVQEPAAAIPWAQVGPGWSVAEWSPAHAPGASAGTVFLVSPVGVRYEITHLAADEYVRLWSTTARTMLIEKQASFTSTYRQLDMSSGRSRPLPLPGPPFSYTPDGRYLLATSGSNDATLSLVRSGDATMVVTYPIREPGVGVLDNRPLQSPDGSTLVFGADHGLAALTITGQLIRTLPSPVPNDECSPLSYSAADVVVAACDDSSTSADGPHPSTWSVPLSGATSTRLDIALGAKITDPGYFGYADVWHTSTGEFGSARNSCGPTTLVRFDGNGRPTPVTITYPRGAAPGHLAYVSHDGDNVTLSDLDAYCNSASNSLIRLNTATGTTVAILGPGANGGTVDSVEPFGGEN